MAKATVRVIAFRTVKARKTAERTHKLPDDIKELGTATTTVELEALMSAPKGYNALGYMYEGRLISFDDAKIILLRSMGHNP